MLDGRALAELTKERIATEVAELTGAGQAVPGQTAPGQAPPGLGTLLVGDDPASQSYVDAKIRDCAEVGIRSVHHALPATATQDQLLETIAALNDDPAVSAYIVQLPLPPHLDEAAALAAVDPDKDADGLHPYNLGRLVMGAPGPLPCTPRGIQLMLAHYGVPTAGRHIVVVGRGLTIGRPLALLMTQRQPDANAAVTVVHTGVDDLAYFTRQADVLISAAGVPDLITPDMVRAGAAVVSAGITREGRRIIPDVDETVGEVAAFITPRLGGVGPMTRAMLLANTLDAARRRAAS